MAVYGGNKVRGRSCAGGEIAMVMTEQEAQRKVCPIMRYCVNDNAQYVANFSIQERQYCAGSACAAWRWFEMDYSTDRVGYCGMAGPVKYA